MPVHNLSIQRILNVVQRATQMAAQANRGTARPVR